MSAKMRIWAWQCAALFCGMACCGALWGQSAAPQEQTTTTVHGRVLNKITKEPIGRALVTMAGNEYATLTDERGQFEFRIVESFTPGGPGTSRVTNQFVEVKKPGFLEGRKAATWRYAEGASTESQSEVTIYLSPDALITGHVNVPGSEGDVRIECELYRLRLQEGRMSWSPAGRFTTWADGEFRFSELEPGTYKLITHEQMDFESMLPIPGAPLFGYPPIYYPNTTDFSAASPIVVRAGETAQLNVTVTRRQYYPVRIPVVNAPTDDGMNLNVHPMGHRSPGWSLGFNRDEQTIEGMLPDGNYTVEAEGFGEQQSTGIANFSVNGAPSEGAPLRLVPNTPLTVTVREEFQSQQNETHPMIMTDRGLRRLPSANLGLVSVEELDRFGGFNFARPAEGSDEHTLIFENVRPGRYKVRVVSGTCYASSIQSGGSDLLHQPLVVGLGGGNPPIEVTLRDDGGEVSGTVEEAKNSDVSSRPGDPNGPFRSVYLLPLGDSFVQYPPMAQFQGEDFTVKQVPPGNYLVLVYPDAQNDLPYGNDEAAEALKNKGQIIQVEAGQKISVKIKMVAVGEGQ